MNKQSAVVILVIFVAMLDVSQCIICYECTNVLSARDCTTITHCGSNEASGGNIELRNCESMFEKWVGCCQYRGIISNEVLSYCLRYRVCVNERYINSNGHVYRRLGCRDRKLCPGSVTGRRKRLSVLEELTICERCCDSDFCQTKICDDIDFAPDRGHLCYSCDQQSGPSTCDKVKECSRDEVCYESRSSYSSSNTRTTGCMSRTSCFQVKEELKTLNFTSANYTETWTDPNGVHRQQIKCFDCCDKDMCNTQCKIPVTACKDTQDIGVCRLAQHLVCQDKVKAANAGCQKFCGFCT